MTKWARVTQVLNKIGLCIIMAVSAIVVGLSLLALSCSPLPVTQDAGRDADGNTEEVEIVSDLAPEPEPEVTWEDVTKELRLGLGPDWDGVEDGLIFDSSDGILRLGKQRGIDPLIIAEEVADLTKTVVALYQLQAPNRDFDGGPHRALYVSWDLYRATEEFADMSCVEVDDEFDHDSEQVPRINPYIVASMGYRESRFAQRTERGYIEQRRGKTVTKITDCLYCRGTKGERGMFRAMPKGFIQRRFMSKSCDPFDRWCSAQMAAKALAYIRCLCIQEYGDACTTDTYVAGYGLRKLPSPAWARHSRGPEKARGFLCAAAPDICDEKWQRSHDDAFALEL